jgi:hypothetical protein
LVSAVLVEFRWVPGMARSQKQKSVVSLHEAARLRGIEPTLEISTKSSNRLGSQLSAFNLVVKTRGPRGMSVEEAFQGSKVFETGGPFTDLYRAGPMRAKRDPRLRESGLLLRFELGDKVFPTRPETGFYDWIYINALHKHRELAKSVRDYKAFSDIEFNPKKSINCQARAAALYVALVKRRLLKKALASFEDFLLVGWGSKVREPRQLSLFETS